MTGVTIKRRPSAARSPCGVSADWEYFQRTCGGETMVIEYQGFEFASTRTSDDCGGTIQLFTQAMPCNYFAPLTHTGNRVPWRELLLALNTPAALEEFDWRYSHDLVADECALNPVCVFSLPPTLDGYLATLSKDNRYEFRRTNRQCAHLTVRMELPSRPEVARMLDLFAEHQLKKYSWYYAADDIVEMRQAVELFIVRAEALGTLFPMSVYDGPELIALNIAEKVGDRIIDTEPMYDHDKWHLPIGTFMINRNIEAAIAHECVWYDLGLLDDSLSDHRISEVYRYKTKWLPRGVVLPHVYGYAVLSANQSPVPPYIDFDTKELRVA